MTAQDYVLYRLWSPSGVLLYVGITNDPGRRWREHAAGKSWWFDVASITIEHFETAGALTLAERVAIVQEGPIYNVVHNRREVARWARIEADARRAGFDDVVVPRSTRADWTRRHDRVSRWAMLAFFVFGSTMVLASALPGVLRVVLPGWLGASAAVTVYSAAAVYLPLRARMLRLDRCAIKPASQ